MFNTLKVFSLLAAMIFFSAFAAFAIQPKEELTDAQKKIGSHVLLLKDELGQETARVKAMMAVGKAARLEPEKLSDRMRKIDKDGRIQLYIKYSSNPEKLAQDIESAGGKVEIVSKPMSVIQAWLPYDKIEELAGKEYVQDIMLPDYAIYDTGSVTSEGDAVHSADKVRSLFGITGKNIKVGVISNGINGIAASQATNDIPTSYQKQSARADNNLNNGAEGLAMMEIIYDLAPDAALAFSNSGTSVEMINAIQILDATFGCHIIVDDVNYSDQPYFEDGQITSKINDFVGKGKLYVTSAGNRADKQYYEGDFSGTAKTIGVTPMTVQDFSGSGDWNMEMTIPANTTTYVYLQWDDLFGASGNDYDLYITDSTGTIVYGSGTNTQNGNDNPTEWASVVNNNSSTAVCYVVVRKRSGSNKRLKIVSFEGKFEEYSTPVGCILEHHFAKSAISAGAIKYSTPTVIENFSSQGPVRIEYPAIESRAKPDLCGIDGVSITGNGGFASPFYGTSAAAPHIAALAALIWSSNTSLSSSEVRNLLQNNCVDLGAAGYDYIYGKGRANVYKIFATPPSAPSTPTCQQSRNRITLNWTASTQSDVDSYRIYRSASQSGPYTYIASVDATTATYTDTVTQEGTYYYKISAFNSAAGLESPLSNSTSAIISFSLSDVFVYPNPLILSSSPEAVFGGLSGNETIRIYTMTGELLTSVQAQGASQWIWNARNASGKSVARGIYIYLITRPTGEKRLGKIAAVN